MARSDELKNALKSFQDLSIDFATGRKIEFEKWEEARANLLAQPELLRRIPSWVSSCRWGSQFWQFMKQIAPDYQGRREFIWNTLAPVFSFIERGSTEPTAASIEPLLEQCSSDAVSECWTRIQARRDSDPEGAITASRSLLESTCKYVLGELGAEYGASDDLPTLYRKAAAAMNLGPESHNEKVFKQILSGCVSVVGGLASLRNTLGDAHGKAKVYPKPSGRHADLAVNLGGTLSAFLIATYEERHRRN